MSRPTLVLTEWSKVGPRQAPLLGGLSLTGADRRLLERLAHTSLRVTELREGLEVAVGPHLGSVTLEALRIDLVPKLGLERVLEMAAYGLGLGELTLVSGAGDYRAGSRGLVELLGVALLRAVEEAVRGGLLEDYRTVEDWRDTPRGRVLAPRRPPGHRVICRYQELTLD
ncbi:MAG: hypothetical protein R3310_15750, partial [Candidatus Competibacteraceae bacterium]|nr:hypothetical protein [Candidatus Competibacteraceae bacterium]